jgi:hypothetical protein
MKKYMIVVLLYVGIFNTYAQETEKSDKKWHLGLSYIHSISVLADYLPIENDINHREDYYLAGLEISYRTAKQTRLFGYLSAGHFKRAEVTLYRKVTDIHRVTDIDIGTGVYTSIAKISDKERLVFHGNLMFYKGNCIYCGNPDTYYLAGIELGLPGYSYNAEKAIFTMELFYKAYVDIYHHRSGFSFNYIGFKSSLLYKL